MLPIRGCLLDARQSDDEGRLLHGSWMPSARFATQSIMPNELLEKYLTTVPEVIDQLRTLSGCRLLCHCRVDQACHGDIIIRHFKSRYPMAHDRTDAMSRAPRTDVLSYMAKLREAREKR